MGTSTMTYLSCGFLMQPRFKEPKVRDEKHRRFIASLPCLVSKVSGQTQCAHIRKGTGGGMGLRPSDEFCVPLSCAEHAEQHRVGETVYWGDSLPRAIEIARELYEATGDRDRCLWIMLGFKRGLAT